MNLNNKSVLVTGGAGFIGSQLVDALIDEKPSKIIVVDNMSLGKEENLNEARKNFPDLQLYKEDISDFKIMKKIFKDNNIDVVFNLAAIPLPHSLDMPRQNVSGNINMVITLCELQRLKLFKTLIHFSSSEVYGSAQNDSMDEKHPLEPSTPYAASKAAGDLIVLSYNKTFDTDCAIIRPFNNYGPRQNEGSYAGVIPLTMKRIIADEAPVIYGDGTQTRDFIYVTDTARMAIEIYKNEDTRGKIINIGSGKEISILNLVKKIIELTGFDKEIIFEKPRAGDVNRHIANADLAKKLLGFEQTIDFEEGIKKTIEWYKGGLRS